VDAWILGTSPRMTKKGVRPRLSGNAMERAGFGLLPVILGRANIEVLPEKWEPVFDKKRET
jgi:hypothetical protein